MFKLTLIKKSVSPYSLCVLVKAVKIVWSPNVLRGFRRFLVYSSNFCDFADLGQMLSYTLGQIRVNVL